jgi:hypothetical protein
VRRRPASNPGLQRPRGASLRLHPLSHSLSTLAPLSPTATGSPLRVPSGDDVMACQQAPGWSAALARPALLVCSKSYTTVPPSNNPRLFSNGAQSRC